MLAPVEETRDDAAIAMVTDVVPPNTKALLVRPMQVAPRAVMVEDAVTPPISSTPPPLVVLPVSNRIEEMETVEVLARAAELEPE